MKKMIINLEPFIYTVDCILITDNAVRQLNEKIDFDKLEKVLELAKRESVNEVTFRNAKYITPKTKEKIRTSSLLKYNDDNELKIIFME